MLSLVAGRYSNIPKLQLQQKKGSPLLAARVVILASAQDLRISS